MNRKLKVGVLGIVVVGAIIGGVALLNLRKTVILVAMGVNDVRYASAPKGQISTEQSLSAPVVAVPTVPLAIERIVAGDDWPSYNKNLESVRFSELVQISRENVTGLKIQCVYDTHSHVSFQSGILVVNGALIATTDKDTISIDPMDCHQNWRVHENYKGANLIGVNRGAAYMDDKLFRGTQDGRVLAYDFTTGRQLWSTSIADPTMGETAPSAPIAWNGLVFIGNAGGDGKGVKGRMYALDAKTGGIVWEFYLVPRMPGDQIRGPQGAGTPSPESWGSVEGVPITGGAVWTSYTLDPDKGLLYVPTGNAAPDFAVDLRKGSDLFSDSVVVLDAKSGRYVRHFQTLQKDWHDWDVSNPPALITTRAGRDIMAEAPKDGHLYGYDLDSGKLLYRTAVNRMENIDVPFSTTESVHYCPGSAGGAEWSSPSYNPITNLVTIGEVDWCYTVKLQSDKKIETTKKGGVWMGAAYWNPYNALGVVDEPFKHWGGWLYACDADSGEWKWRVHSNYPIIGGTTATAGGLVFFGDAGGNFYAVDAANGQRLWGQKIGGAIGGGVITYAMHGTQRVAVAAGFESLLWPTEVTTATVVVLGL